MAGKTKKILLLSSLSLSLSLFLLFLFLFFPAAPEPQTHSTAYAAQKEKKWLVMPIRTKAEFKAGKPGGEGEQHFHGITRSPSNPDVIYLSQDVAQVWKSSNGGTSWKKPLCKNMYVTQGQSIEVDPVNPDIVFAILENHMTTAVTVAENFVGLYRSQDGGTTWKHVLREKSIINRIYQHTIAYDPSSIRKKGATTWYAAFPGSGLYRSDNGGKSWRLLKKLKKHTIIYSIQVHPKNGSLFLGSNQGLFKMRRNSNKLLAIRYIERGPVSSIAMHPRNPRVFYIVIEGKGLYRTVNGGSTFSLLKQFDAFQVFLNPGFPHVMYLTGIRQNTLVSSDGGRNWRPVGVVPPKGFGRNWKNKFVGKATAIVPNPKDPKEAVAYSMAAIWKTTNGGKTFTNSSTLFTGFAWSWWNKSAAFDIHNPDRFLFFNCDVSTTITTTGGKYFEQRRIPWAWVRKRINWMGMHAGDIQPVKGSQIVVASAGFYFNTKLVRSIDAGKNWTIVDNEYNNNLFIAFHPGDPKVVYAGNKISTDAGKTFKKIDYLAKQKAEIMGMCRAHPNTIYALPKPRNRIFRSDNRGKTWRIYAKAAWQFNGLDSKPTFAVDPVNPNIIYTLDRKKDLAVYNGKKWKSLGVLKLAGGKRQGNYVGSVAIDPRHSNILYAGMQAAGISHIWRSRNRGKTWQDISYNLPRTGATVLAVHPVTGDLFHGSLFGTWIFPPPYSSARSIYHTKKKYLYESK
ncbi:MAG: hypothetical protein GY754_26825 [bacterium]|nr:hypothetical protein [bacterium]